MNNTPRETLRRIVSKYGREIGSNPKRCESLLNDLCGEYRREINVLVNAIDERVPLDLLAGVATMPREMLLNRLEKRLEEHTAMTREAARWSVESWALALNLATEVDIERRNELTKPAPNVQPTKAIEPDDSAINRTPQKPNRTIPAEPRPPIFVPIPKVNPQVIRQPTRPTPTAPPTINQPAAPPAIQNQPTAAKRRFRIVRGCLFVLFFLAVTSAVIFFGVPYAIEVMRETQRERNSEPPRFPVR